MTDQLIPAILIPTALIDVSADHRKVDPDAAQTLAENAREHGIRQPIEIITNGDRYRLVFGATRLAAAKLLDLPVPAFVKQPEQFANEASIRLVTIAENFIRRDLSVLDRSVDIAAWCAIYRAAQPPMKPGPKAAKDPAGELSVNLTLNSEDAALYDISEQFSVSFSDAAQRFLGVSRRGVFRAIKIASIPSALRDRIALHALSNNQSELLALAAEAFDRQSLILNLILSCAAANIADAMSIIDKKPVEVIKARWEKMADGFARLKTAEQHSFFDLHEAAITRWAMERKG